MVEPSYNTHKRTCTSTTLVPFSNIPINVLEELFFAGIYVLFHIERGSIYNLSLVCTIGKRFLSVLCAKVLCNVWIEKQNFSTKEFQYIQQKTFSCNCSPLIHYYYLCQQDSRLHAI